MMPVTTDNEMQMLLFSSFTATFHILKKTQQQFVEYYKHESAVPF